MSSNHFHPEHNIHIHSNLETTSSNLQTQIQSNDTDITNLFSQTSGVGTSGLKVLITDNTTNTTANATAINANDTDITNLFSQTSGVGTSGLKSLIQSNDTDIGIINNMIETDGNNNTVLKTGAGNKIQFSIGGQVFFNSNEIKNLTDNVLISSNVNINTLDTELTGIKNNSLSSTLKTAVDANTSKTGITSSQASAITANTAKTGITSSQASAITANTAKTGITSSQASAITANSAKNTTQWSNNGSEVYINQNVGINNSNPNVNLEIGSGTSAPVRMRLNGSNGVANSSEIIFTDNLQGSNPDFYQGATIRFNSSANRLEINTDNGNDNITEPALYIYRADVPYVTVQTLYATDLNVQNCNLRPETRYIYGRRVNSTIDTDSDIAITTEAAGGRDLVYRNILVNDMTYNTTTGVFTVSITGLYHVIACIQADAGSGAESVLTLSLKDAANNNILKARSHVSRHESNNDSAMQLNMNAIARLVAGTNYNFNASSDNGGSAIIQNNEASCNSLIIKGVILENTTTVPTNWGTAA